MLWQATSTEQIESTGQLRALVGPDAAAELAQSMVKDLAEYSHDTCHDLFLQCPLGYNPTMCTLIAVDFRTRIAAC